MLSKQSIRGNVKIFLEDELLNKDQVLEFRKAKWKYDPSPENLMSVTRNRY